MRVRCVDTNASARDEWVMLVGWGGTPKSINAQFQIAPIRGHKSIMPGARSRGAATASRNVSVTWAPLQRAANTGGRAGCGPTRLAAFTDTMD